jgi:hypothetical protein
LYAGVLGSLQAKPILKGTTMAVYASGYLLFMRDTRLLAQPFDLRRLEVIGEPGLVAEVRRVSGPYDATADGKKFLINSGDVKESGEPVTLVLNWSKELKK